MGGIIIKILFAVTTFISIIWVLNYLSPNLQQLGESILVQDFIKDEETDKHVIPFSGLMLLQKSFILMMAWLAYFLQNWLNKSQGAPEVLQGNQNQTSTIDNQQLSQSPPQTIELKYQLLIGVSSFLSIYLFSQIQDKIQVRTISYSKYYNVLLAFVIIHFYFINKSSVLKIEFSNWFFKLIYIAFKCYLFYYMVISIHIVVFETQLWNFYYDKLYMQFVQFQNDYSYQTIATFGFALLAESTYYFSLCLLKNKHPNISTIRMLKTMMKYNIVSFTIYALFNGELLETLKYLVDYPLGWGILTEYCTYNFLIYLILAYSIVSYPPSLFMSVMLTRAIFEKYQEHIKNQQLKLRLQYIATILAVCALELIIYKRFQQKQRLKSYNRIKGERNDEIAFTEDNIEPRSNKDSGSIHMNDNIQNNLSERTKILQ